MAAIAAEQRLAVLDATGIAEGATSSDEGAPLLSSDAEERGSGRRLD